MDLHHIAIKIASDMATVQYEIYLDSSGEETGGRVTVNLPDGSVISGPYSVKG